MKWKRSVGVILVTASLALGAWSLPSPSPTPSSSPEPVLSAEETGWLNTLNGARAGQEVLTPRRVRFRRSTWPGAVVVGYIMDSKACVTGSVIFQGKALDLRQGAAELLSTSGWQQASVEDRRTLALRFVDQIIMGMGDTLLRQAPDYFPKDKNKKNHFTNLATQATGAGGVTVTGWIEEATNGQPFLIYRKSQYVFSPKGELERSRILERVVVEL